MTERILPEPEKFASFPVDGRILDYYKGQFDSVYILLHPFIHPKSIEIERFCPKFYPKKHEMIEGCEAVRWKKILELTNLNALSEIYIGLRTRIHSLREEYANETFASCLEELIDKHGIIPPSGDSLPELIENRIYEAIRLLGYRWLWIGDQFGTERKLHWIDDLTDKDDVPSNGCIFTHDHSILITTALDQHYSFLCSSRKIIEQILDIDNFEGFYCTEKTEVSWGFSDK
jgi:hypothetical protein